MAQTLQLRGGTAAEWTSANPILAAREVCIETDTNKIKIGDGINRWASLPYMTQGTPGAKGDSGTPYVFVQPTQPSYTDPYLWWQTGLGDDGSGFTLWVNTP